jgi:hypothetical protein
LPGLSARSLTGCAYTFPADLGGKPNVLVLVFERRQQPAADSWFPFLERLMAEHQDLRAYTLRLMANGYTLARPFIDGGMVAEIHSQIARERTLTVYTDVRQLAQALDIPTTAAAVLLVDAAGRIGWRGQGRYDPVQAAALARAVAGMG